MHALCVCVCVCVYIFIYIKPFYNWPYKLYFSYQLGKLKFAN